MNCDRCQKELTEGENVFEVGKGYVNGESVAVNESIAVFCEKCEEEIMPAFWADVNEE